LGAAIVPLASSPSQFPSTCVRVAPEPIRIASNPKRLMTRPRIVTSDVGTSGLPTRRPTASTGTSSPLSSMIGTVSWPGCVVPSIVVPAPVMFGSWLVGLIVRAPVPIENAMTSFSGDVFAARIASRRVHCSMSQTPGGPSSTVLTVNVAAPATGVSPSAAPTTTVADASFLRIPSKQPTPPTGPRRMWTPGSNELFGFFVNAVRIGPWSSLRGDWPIRQALRHSSAPMSRG
jgi:hypothetical protein